MMLPTAYAATKAQSCWRGQPSSTGGSFLSPDLTKGGLPMVTYSDLIQIGILIVGICSLIIQIIQISKMK